MSSCFFSRAGGEREVGFFPLSGCMEPGCGVKDLSRIPPLGIRLMIGKIHRCQGLGLALIDCDKLM